MRILKLDPANASDINRIAAEAAGVLLGGGIVVYPTDTAYGLGAHALKPEAVEKIFALKKRKKQKPLSVAIRDIAMAKRYAIIPVHAENFLAQVWPGAVTVVFPKRSTLPDLLTGGKPGIGLRHPKHLFHEALFSLIDFPVTATSANLSGEAPAYDPVAYLGAVKTAKRKPDLFIDAGVLPESPPSTIIDVTGKAPRILRVGPVSPEKLIAIFKKVNVDV